MSEPLRRPRGAEQACFDEVRNMPGHMLRRFQQIAVSIFLKDCKAFDLTPVQFSVLAALSETNPLDQIRLGGVVALDRTTISLVVRKLEERGLVVREVSQKDRRSKLISLTKAGRALAEAALPSVRAIQDKILAPLTEDEQEMFMALLQKAVEANNQQSRAPLRSV
jgi:MarR family transcriptional regulator, lower aerobic nicotinate degradation pathway regulator